MKRHFVSCWQGSNSIGKWLPVVLTLSLIGCSRQPESGRLLASAGNSKLYLNEVSIHVDTASAYAVRNYVSNWVNQQLLYNEAQKLGIDNAPEFRRRIGEFSRQLSITMLLNRRVYNVPVDLSEEDIAAFYNKNRDQFRATGEIDLVNMAGFDNRNFAVKFRNALVSGSNWNEVFNDLPTYAILDVRDSVYLKESDANPAIWNVIGSLGEGRVSFPVQVDTMSYVVQVIKKIRAGDPLPLDYASPFIKERLTIEKRKKLYDALLDSLRSVGNFQIDPSVAIRDTSVQE